MGRERVRETRGRRRSMTACASIASRSGVDRARVFPRPWRCVGSGSRTRVSSEAIFAPLARVVTMVEGAAAGAAGLGHDEAGDGLVHGRHGGARASSEDRAQHGGFGGRRGEGGRTSAPRRRSKPARRRGAPGETMATRVLRDASRGRTSLAARRARGNSPFRGRWLAFRSRLDQSRPPPLTCV